jgi:predicted NAD/FAD-binding protein
MAKKPVKIAIIGSGISGLATAWFLAGDNREITIFEKSDTPGGHAHTLFVNYEEKGNKVVVQVNTAFDIFNRETYPNFIALLDELRLPYEPREFTYTFECRNGNSGGKVWEILFPIWHNLRNARQLLDPDFRKFARQALTMLENPTQEESRILGLFRYQAVSMVVHSDTGLMPAKKEKWSYFNINFNIQENDSYNTVWFGQKANVPVFLTSYRNLLREPAPELVFGKFEYEMPIFTTANFQARQDLENIQGNLRTWYTGVYTGGSGHHEGGLESARKAAAGILKQI